MGFNDDDPDSDSGKVRILVLGDSLTEALQVQRQDNFTSIAETMEPCLDFYNAGRSGLSPVHYPTVLSRVKKSFTPALTVVVVTAGDMADINTGNFRIVRDDNKRIIDLQLKEEPLSRLRLALDPLLSRSALATYLVQRFRAIDHQ